MPEDNEGLIERVVRYGEGWVKFACPGDEQDTPTWILRFADKDCGEQVFIGETAEADAWAAWNRYAPSYNCWLFRVASLQGELQEPSEAMIEDICDRHFGKGEWTDQAFAAVKEALALRTAAPQVNEAWQPIETAPKDGTHILACIAGTSFGYLNGSPLPPLQSVVHWWGNPGEEGFYTSVNERAPDRPFEATHWKPLDAPATPQGGIEQGNEEEAGE